MGTLRQVLAGVFTLALLGSASTTSVAQDDVEAGFTAINGTMTVLGEVASPEIATSPDVPQERGTGWVFKVRLDTNDPRLSGTFDPDHNYFTASPGLMDGTVWSVTGRLTNDGGSWRFEGQGFAQPGKSFAANNHYVGMYTGEGGYEGLSAMTFQLPKGSGRWDITGVLFPGPMPEFPPPMPPAK